MTAEGKKVGYCKVRKTLQEDRVQSLAADGHAKNPELHCFMRIPLRGLPEQVVVTRSKVQEVEQS